MTAFAAALRVAFQDPNHAVPATITKPGTGGTVTPCRIVWVRGDRDASLFQTGVSAPARIAEVLASAATPDEGDTLTVGALTYTIAKATQPDDNRLIWRLELA